MRRRGGTGKPAKPLARKTAGAKHRESARPERRRPTPSVAQLQEQVATLTRELDTLTRELKEAREQQTASAEVLRVISSSPGELEPVFQAMLENATRVCQASSGTLFRYLVRHGAKGHEVWPLGGLR